MTPADVARVIDHTLLKADATRADIDRLCREGVAHGFAAVCVTPVWVKECAAQLQATGVAICTVVGFPLGATWPDVKRLEAERAIAEGAAEIDMVINIGALKSGDLTVVARDVRAVTEVCRGSGALSKVIIETALLTDEEKASACRIAMAAGADVVKTSTGFGPGGATVKDVALIRRVVGAHMGIKASGGIRSLQTLEDLLAAGATRIGTSAGVRLVAECVERSQ